MNYNIKPNFSESMGHIYGSMTTQVTLQVTDDCTCKCSYCYQTNKGHNKMTKKIGRIIADILIEMGNTNDDTKLINSKTSGLVIFFIGGEPFLNIDVMDDFCHYFIEQCIQKKPEWLLTLKFALSSNGDLLFDPKVQHWIKEFKDFLSIQITVDGPKELHDRCRKHLDGTGNYDNAYKALKWLESNGFEQETKITISPDNLVDLNTILDFFLNENVTNIIGNPIYEQDWTIPQAQLYYLQLKAMADKLLAINNNNIYVSFFDTSIGKPKAEDDLQCWCGGEGKMLAFDSDGIAYPCIRYMDSSLNGDQPPVEVGDIYRGIYETEKDKQTQEILLKVNRRTKNTDECFYCPIATGCADCAAWNYQESGKFDFKSMHICNMHKARVIANAYFWNKYYLQNNIKDKIFNLNLSKEECLKFINKDEYDSIIDLIKQQKEIIGES